MTLRFGVSIERIELKTIRLEEKFVATMAVEGTTYAREAGRSALADGELASAPMLVQAADGLTTTPNSTALMLRYMQCAIRMAVKSESGTTLFPVPIDFDWKNMLQHNRKQRRVWLDAVAEGRRAYEAADKEKAL